jgi:hypothetical protein
MAYLTKTDAATVARVLAIARKRAEAEARESTRPPVPPERDSETARSRTA